MIGNAIRFLVAQRLLVTAVVASIAVGGVVAYQHLIIDVFPDPVPWACQRDAHFSRVAKQLDGLGVFGSKRHQRG